MIDPVDLCERGWIPDGLARFGMRRLIRQRLREVRKRGDAGQRDFVASLHHGPIAVATDTANAQHYEVPAELFDLVLGPRSKYSSAWYPDLETGDLATAEEAMLDLTCQRAGVENGMNLLDLGCGWGSLSLWLAERYPRSRVTGVSNSASQRARIEARARRAGLDNLRIVTADVVAWETDAHFDRILSVEMFEHMSNWAALLDKVTDWLTPDGRLLTHVFCHRALGYHYEVGDGWMERYFFTGGIMPREDLFEHFPEQVHVEERWWTNGRHYERTLNDWLLNLDARREEVAEVCMRTYGADEASLWLQRWRMFFMACAELFGLDGGSRYGVVHTLMRRA